MNTQIKKPTSREFDAWWTAQPEAQKCTGCGREGTKGTVQPQHPYYAEGKEGVTRCWECLNKINAEIRAKRKAELAAMAKCEVCTRRRGTYKVGTDSVLLCGLCFTKVKAERNKRASKLGNFAYLAWFGEGMPSNREAILSYARGDAEEAKT